jgi:L-alanine-DL-glutamate epimerase-like enolase superfamily enzyme
MQSANIKIKEIRARQIKMNLPDPIQLGSYVMTFRTFAHVAVELADGTIGNSFGLDRSAPTVEAIKKVVIKGYQDIFTGDPVSAYEQLMRQAGPVLSAGASLRGVSLVDLAAHDAVAKHEKRTVMDRFGKKEKSFPKWAVIGYPPSRGPDEIAWEVQDAVAAGAVGVKLPVGLTPELTRARIEAALATGLCQVATDLAWSCRVAEDAVKIVGGLDLAWVEDPFLPGNMDQLRRLRSLQSSPVATGDDESHLYHPQALLETESVDIIRLDATCQGGLSRLYLLNEFLTEKNIPISWHVYDSWHSQIAAILDAPSLSVEYSAPGANVDPLQELIFANRAKTVSQDLYGWKMTMPDLEDEVTALAGGAKWIPILN